MNTRVESGRTSLEESAIPQLDPDVLVLGEYIAQKRGMSFVEFLEYLITKEASKGKYPELQPT